MIITPRRMLEFVGFDFSEKSVEEAVLLERTVLQELEWCVYSSTCIRAIYQIVDSLSISVHKESILMCCFAICDYLVLSPRFYDFPLFDIAVSVIQHVQKSNGVLRGRNMVCRIWIESMIDQVQDLLQSDQYCFGVQHYQANYLECFYGHL